MLPQLVKEYNNTKHSSIKMTPTEAYKKNMEPLSVKPKFKDCAS